MKIEWIVMSVMVFLTAFSHVAHAQDARNRGGYSSLCSNEEPKVTVKLATAKTEYIKTQDAYGLTSMHNTGRGITLGLAGGPVSITVQGQFQAHTLNGKACVELKKLEVLFWAKPQVMIANNFEKGSCEYQEVLGHEQKHIRALRKFVRLEAPKLKKEVIKIVDSSRTQYKVKEEAVTSAQKDMEEQIYNRLQAYQQKIMPVLQNIQAEIDSAEEYKRVADQCDNWGRKIAKSG